MLFRSNASTGCFPPSPAWASPRCRGPLLAAESSCVFNTVRFEVLTHLLFAATPLGRPLQVNWRLPYLYILPRVCVMVTTEHPGNARFVFAPPASRAPEISQRSYQSSDHPEEYPSNCAWHLVEQASTSSYVANEEDYAFTKDESRPPIPKPIRPGTLGRVYCRVGII